jgi:hypothetical protein
VEHWSTWPEESFGVGSRIRPMATQLPPPMKLVLSTSTLRQTTSFVRFAGCQRARARSKLANEPTLEVAAVQYASSLSAKKYSDEASTQYGLAVALHASRLRSTAEGKARGEMVLVEHVDEAVSELSPDRAGPFKTLVDWVKRTAYLTAGLTIAQGVNVWHQNPIARGSVIWLISVLIVTVLLIGLGLGLDFPSLRKAFKRRK